MNLDYVFYINSKEFINKSQKGLVCNKISINNWYMILIIEYNIDRNIKYAFIGIKNDNR